MHENWMTRMMRKNRRNANETGFTCQEIVKRGLRLVSKTRDKLLCWIIFRLFIAAFVLSTDTKLFASYNY